jgi:Mg2+/Co2+ transporter CorB
LNELSVAAMVTIILVLVALSAFFSSTETALMSINRYRLRHQAKQGNRSARLVEQLLQRPDRLIGIILLGNNIVNIGAATMTSILALRLGGEPMLAIGTGILTAVLLIFGEITPKTYGALYPERLAYPAGWVYTVLVRALYPLVWMANLISNGILRLLRVSTAQTASHSLSADELRTVVAEASTVIPHRHQSMLMNILDLEKVTVDDIMIPRNEIAGLDIDADWDDIVELLRTGPHTRLPVYEGSLENIIGILHLKKVAQALAHGKLDKEELLKIARAREPYYVPSGTTLNTQLLNFQHLRRRIALIVNEYGDIQGLVTLEDLLEEIVGEFTTDPGILHKDIHRESGGSYVVNGGINIRTLNRRLGWNLPTTGPRTLNGLILEYLETIPDVGVSLRLGDYSVEILQTADNTVKTARMNAAPIKSKPAKEASERAR